MSDLSFRRPDSLASRVLGWAIAVAYIANSLLLVQLPRTGKTSALRETLRGWHYLIGALLLVLVAWRLWRWWRERPVSAPPGLGAGVHHFARQLTLVAYCVLLVLPFLGLLYGWHEGLTIHFGPLFRVPALVEETRRGWMFFGYFHSAGGFIVLLLTVAAVGTGLYSLLRYGRGLLAAFPAGFGALVYGSFLVSVYALSSFKSPGPGQRAVAIVLAITLAAWLLGRWLDRRRRTGSLDRRPGLVVRAGSVLACLALIALGAYGPHALFRVTPWPVGEAIEVAGGVTSHAAPVMQVTVFRETDFDRRVVDETYKWCRFCHTTGKDAPHLAGPNLYAIFGQKAGTVPNFFYSKAMAEAGRKGLVWNDETLDRYIAGPDQYIHGTSMIISSGPVKTPEERRAVINALKRETMAGAIIEAP